MSDKNANILLMSIRLTKNQISSSGMQLCKMVPAAPSDKTSFSLLACYPAAFRSNQFFLNMLYCEA